MSGVKQFGASASRAPRPRPEDDDTPPPEKLGICGETMTFIFPGTGQLSYFGTITSMGSGMMQSAGLLRFFSSMIESEDHKHHLTQMVLERRFEMEDALEAFEELLERWGADRPTQAASGSSPSQPNTGKPSTANSRRAKSTRGSSRSTASST